MAKASLSGSGATVEQHLTRETAAWSPARDIMKAVETLYRAWVNPAATVITGYAAGDRVVAAGPPPAEA